MSVFKNVALLEPHWAAVVAKLAASPGEGPELAELIREQVAAEQRAARREQAMTTTPNRFLALLESAEADDKLVSSCPAATRAAFLAEHVFDFTTYEDEFAHEFGVQALRVCRAISERKTYDFIKPIADRRWFLLMCNMPFFRRRINWGTSIRGAWWDISPPNDCLLAWPFREQPIPMNDKSWQQLVAAMLEFAAADLAEFQRDNPSTPGDASASP